MEIRTRLPELAGQSEDDWYETSRGGDDMVEGRRDGLLAAGTGILMKEMLRRKGLSISSRGQEATAVTNGFSVLPFLSLFPLKSTLKADQMRASASGIRSRSQFTKSSP